MRPHARSRAGGTSIAIISYLIAIFRVRVELTISSPPSPSTRNKRRVYILLSSLLGVGAHFSALMHTLNTIFRLRPSRVYSHHTHNCRHTSQLPHHPIRSFPPLHTLTLRLKSLRLHKGTTPESFFWTHHNLTILDLCSFHTDITTHKLRDSPCSRGALFGNDFQYTRRGSFCCRNSYRSRLRNRNSRRITRAIPLLKLQASTRRALNKTCTTASPCIDGTSYRAGGTRSLN